MSESTTHSPDEDNTMTYIVIAGVVCVGLFFLPYPWSLVPSNTRTQVDKISLDDTISRLDEFSTKECTPLPENVSVLWASVKGNSQVFAQLLANQQRGLHTERSDIFANQTFRVWSDILDLYALVYNMQHMRTAAPEHESALYDCLTKDLLHILVTFDASEDFFFQENSTSATEKYDEGVLATQIFDEIRKRVECEPVPAPVRIIYLAMLKRIDKWASQALTLQNSQFKVQKFRLWSKYCYAYHEQLGIYSARDQLECVTDVMRALKNFTQFVTDRFEAA